MEHLDSSESWASDIIALPHQMNQIVCSCIINDKQCSVLKSLAEYTANYVQHWWITVFREETKSTSAAAVGRELLRVLNRGLHILQLCADKNSPAAMLVSIILGGAGEFSEIVNDVKKYGQMMTTLIVNSPGFLSSHLVKGEVFDKLKFKIEFDCEILETTLRWACNQDKLALLRRLESERFGLFRRLLESMKSQPGSVGSFIKWLWGPDARIFGNIPKKFLKSCLIPFLETGLLPIKPSISYNDLDLDMDLGKGGYGKVKRAIWCKLPVAVKEMALDDSFNSELKIFRKLMFTDLSHIVQLLGHSTNNGRKYIVLELMDTDLEKLIEEKMKINPTLPFSLPESVDIMLQIAKGMKNLHNIDVIYGDMKPSNVLVKIREDGSFLVKLADFGVSKGSFKTKTVQTQLGGTIMYMAPEILEERGEYSRKLDVYSFAMVCSQILTGRLPFSPHKSIGEIKELVIDKGQRPLLPIGIPTILKDLLHRCWELYERPSFEDICYDLWFIKEKLLITEWDYLNELSIDYAKFPILPQIFTPTHQKAILCYGKECLSSKYFVKNLPINFLTDIQFGQLAVESSGDIRIVDLPDTLQNPWNLLLNPFLDGNGVDPQNLLGGNPPEDLGIFGQFKKLLQNQGRKFNISLAIGGWDYSKYFSDAFSTGATRTTFINCVVSYLKGHPIFNGICINWQYVSDNGKNYGKQDNIVRCEDGENLILVLEMLKKVLPSNFTISVPSRAKRHQVRWPVEKAIHLIDQLHVVATDFQEDLVTKRSVHKSNIYCSSNGEWSVDEAIRSYLSRGVPSFKLFIGTSLRSIRFGNTDGMGKPAEGSTNVSLRYCDLPVPGSEEMWDDDAKASYAYDPVRRIVDTYDNIRSIVEKAKYIKDNKLGGIILWEICSDYPSSHERSIVKALHDHLTHG